MKLSKSYCIPLLLVVFASLFSSCDDLRSSYWKKATLDVNFNLTPDTYTGYYETRTTIRANEIPELNYARERLLDIRTMDSWITLSNLRRNDYINSFYITVVGVGTYAYEYPISIRQDGEVITIDEAPYFRFMDNVMRRLASYGYVDMTIKFYSRIYDGGPIYFNLSNNLEIQVTD